MKDDKTHVWILPDSKTILVDQYMGGVPVQACGWSESTKEYVKSLGLTGALYEFKTWNEAGEFARDFCKNHPGWRDEYSSPDGDMAAAISTDDYGFDN